MENNDFASMLEESFGKKIKKGDKVTGEIVSIVDDKTIAISLGTFTEGIMHLDHFTKDKNVQSFEEVVKVGDTIEATVTSVTEDHIYLSHLNQLAGLDTIRQSSSQSIRRNSDMVRRMALRHLKLQTMQPSYVSTRALRHSYQSL